MTSEEIRSRYLKFFEKRGHVIIPSASLIPENDPSSLFTTAGMQPLVPYLLGEKHPAGTRLVDVQKCVRTGDIDEVGDNTHLTFFEMMGNWSLGDYFKEEAITWSYELLTSKEEGFGLDPNRLYMTCFEGNTNAPKDEESAAIWKSIFEKNNIKGERIYFLPAKNNWWGAGDNGPCGPDTEMFYDLTGSLTKGLTHQEFLKADQEQKVVEIWNDVFMEYLMEDGKVVSKLDKKNVDTGSGLERVTTVIQGKSNVYETDLFEPILRKIKELSQNDIVKNGFGSAALKSRRIVADHIRTSVFMISDGVVPSNSDRGYVLRRLLRRAIRHADVLELKKNSLGVLVEVVIEKYSNVYPLGQKAQLIKDEIKIEEDKFRKTLNKGLTIFSKEMKVFDGKDLKDLTQKDIPDLSPIDEFPGFTPFHITGRWLFDFYQTFGFPLELSLEELQNHGRDFLPFELERITNEFEIEKQKHQDVSRAGSEKKFKGGLADTSEKTIQYHTATHLLNAALRKVLGEHVGQKGSNITPERLRFDFSHASKMTEEEKKKTEELVNNWIELALPVSYEEMPREEAEKKAIHAFNEKYGDVVKVYSIGPDSSENYISREFCGGPHVSNTAELKGKFKIQKEEAVSQGVRRIKAVLE